VSHLSLLCQTSDVANLNNVVHCGAIAKACEFLGVSAGVHRDGLSETSIHWLQDYGVRLHDSSVDEAEVLLRAFGLGAFPARPAPPRPLVVDVALFASWFPGDQDYGLAFYDGVFSFLPNVSVDIVAPLPQELGPLFRSIVPRKVVVFLGTDPLARAAGLATSASGQRAARVTGSVKSGEAYDANLTAHVVSLPQGTQVGETLFVWSSFAGNPVVTLPAGWNLLAQGNNGTDVKGVAYWRVADGTETRDIVVTTSSGMRSGHAAYRIAGGATPPLVSAVATGSSVAPDPPAFNPGASLPRLWLALAAHECSGAFSSPVTSFPVGYNEDVAALSSASAAEMAVRRLDAASENPGPFSKVTSTSWVAFTVAIEPEPSPYTSSVVGFSPFDFWRELATADVAMCSPGVPAITASALGIPAIVVANTPAEHTNMLTVLVHGFQGLEYLGNLATLTDEEVADAARTLVEDVSRKHALASTALLQRRKTGVRRIAEWIVRDLVGSTAKQSPLFSFPVWPNIGPIPNPGGF
jgi:hypothetical protein